MTRNERRVFRNSVLVGMLVTLCVLLTQVMGWLQSPENWLYDWRARRFQSYTEKPTDKLVHADIDDKALDVIGPWPWPRSVMAELIDEMNRAGAKAIGLDILYVDPQPATLVAPPATTQPRVVTGEIDHDGLLADAIRRGGNVIVPASIPLEPAGGDRLRLAVIDQLTADLELTESEVAARVAADGVREPDLALKVSSAFLECRREAAYRRIRREMAVSPLSREQLQRAILPRTYATTRPADMNVHSPLTRLIDEQYNRYQAVKTVTELGGPIAPGSAPLATAAVKHPPLERLSSAAAATAFVDVVPPDDGILRSANLLVDVDGRAFPMLGLSLALTYLDLKPGDLTIGRDEIVIPRPGGPAVRVPVRTMYFDRVGLDVPAVFDFPWFGTSRWEPMYDWPAHREPAQHITLSNIWEAVLTRRKIARNEQYTDIALGVVAEVLSLEKRLAQAGNDPAARQAFIRYALNDARDTVESLRQLPLAELEPGHVEFLKAVQTLEETTRLRDQLAAHEKKLEQALKGKAVLVGFTATGNEDAIATSLHGSCPGVVAHGVVFNTILTGQFWRMAPLWVNLLITAGLGLCTAVVAGRLSWQWAFVIVAAMAVLFVLLNGSVMFDRHNTLLALAAPLVAMATVWFCCSVVRIYMETAERKRVERRFRSYVDPAVVNAYIERGEAATTGESRELTVAFTDLAGFTTLSERLGEKTVNLLNDYFDKMVPMIAEKHGIMKFLGDGIMYFYGAPRPNPDHATDAVLTALEMQRRLAEFNDELRRRNLPTLSLRIGINTGVMVVGDAGSRNPIQRYEYTVLGDAVNFASRLEGANKYTGTQVLISARTAELCGERFLLRPVGAIQVVGKAEAVLCFEVLGLAESADEKQRRLREQTRELVEHFRGGRFEAVLQLANQLDQTHGPSKLTSLYRNLAESYLTNPPENNFDGRIELETK